MKLVLIFLTCALLFELSTQIENKPKYMPINPKVLKGGCRIKNGTLICPKPKVLNSTKVSASIKSVCKNIKKCPIGDRLKCYKNEYGENCCDCIRIPKMLKPPTRRTIVCPEGTTKKCFVRFRGCVGFFDCSCIKADEKNSTTNLIKKKGINLMD